MKFIMTNALSFLPKIESLVDYFSEMQLSMAMISETWIKPSNEKYIVEKLHNEHRLKIIMKNRPLKRDGTQVSGGGVAVVFDPSPYT